MFTRLLLMGASALIGASMGYQQGKADAFREQHPLTFKNAETPSLVQSSKELLKKTASSVKQTVEDIATSKEYIDFKTKFSREELMKLLCNSQVFDTVNDILRQNNGEFRPGSYFKGKEWETYKEVQQQPNNSCSPPAFVGANINISKNK